MPLTGFSHDVAHSPVVYCLSKEYNLITVNFLNIRTPKQIVVITDISTMWLYQTVTSPNDADGMANSVDPDQTAPQSDLGLHCLPRHICLKTSDHYGTSIKLKLGQRIFLINY